MPSGSKHSQLPAHRCANMNRRRSVLRPGCVALIVALIFLVCPRQSNAAVGVGPPVAESMLAQGVIELVYYSRRYGWHCGMLSYHHEHRATCQRMREGGYWDDSDRSRYGASRRRSFGTGGRPVEN